MQDTNDNLSLHERHIKALKEILEAPLWPSTIHSIQAVISQLECYDPVLCDPRRNFRMVYHRDGMVAAIKGENGSLEQAEHELAAALGIDTKDLCLWEEWVSLTTSITRPVNS